MRGSVAGQTTLDVERIAVGPWPTQRVPGLSNVNYYCALTWILINRRSLPMTCDAKVTDLCRTWRECVEFNASPETKDFSSLSEPFSA